MLYLLKLFAHSKVNLKLGPEAMEQAKFTSFCKQLSIEEKLNATWTSIANEHSGTYKPRFGAKLSLTGKIKGAPDMVFTWATGSGYIEFKSKSKKLVGNQAYFQNWCEDLSVRHAVVLSCDEAIKVIEDWGIISNSHHST